MKDSTKKAEMKILLADLKKFVSEIKIHDKDEFALDNMIETLKDKVDVY